MNTTHPRVDWLRTAFWLAVLIVGGTIAVLACGWVIGGLWALL